MKWQDVAKILLGILIGGAVLTYSGLFGTLFLLTGVNAEHSGDSYCTDECAAYINVTTTYWRICFAHYDGTKYADDGVLFKKRSRSRTLHVNLDNVTSIISTNPEVQVEWMVPARGAGNWRPIKDGDCWDRRKINKIKLVGNKKEWQTVKWSFDVGTVNIDPYWISGVTIGDKIVQELCEPVLDTWTDKKYIYEYGLECYNLTINTPDGIYVNSSGIRYNKKAICYQHQKLIKVEETEHIEEQVDCIKTGEFLVDDDLFYMEGYFCKLVDEEICCLSNIDGGKYGDWERNDGGVDKQCTKVEDIK